MGEPRSLVCRGLCTPPSPGALHTVTAGCTGAGLGVGVAPLAGPGLPASAVGTGHPRAEGGGQCGACGRERPPPPGRTSEGRTRWRLGPCSLGAAL